MSRSSPGPDRPVDPSGDDRADYDYTGGGEPDTPLQTTLESTLECAVRFDSFSRTLYATDASAYSVTPVGVVIPRTTADVAATVTICADHDVPVLPRGAGTSLAGQAVNEAVVLDFTNHMAAIQSVDPDAQTATLEPGVTLGTLERTVREHDLTFGPDPAWGEQSTIGGAVGNNSSGAHSLRYGPTDAWIESCEVVLADGTVTTLGPISIETVRDRAATDGSLEERLHAAVLDILDREDTIRERYPAMDRNVSGYNLDRLVAEAAGEPILGCDRVGEHGTVNLARLLAGSEGTLAIVTEVTVALAERPGGMSTCLLCYPDRRTAMADVAAVLEHEPAAVEAMDDVLLDLARESVEFGPIAGDLPPGTEATLLVDCAGPDVSTASSSIDRIVTDRHQNGPAIAALEAETADERDRLWSLRKAGLPILLSRTSDEKHISFVEDAAVPPDRLPTFVDRFEDILAEHGTSASFYGHAGPGVLHVRPLVNTKTDAGMAQFGAISEAVADLVVELDGAISGEHGDGRARTQWNERLYGAELIELFRSLKTAVDPEWRLNPGPVCGDVDNRDNLRFDPDYRFQSSFEPVLEWPEENGLQGMVELCHGCGGCLGEQEITGGVMCPTYRASHEEITSTRGRANALRAAMSGHLPPGSELSDEFVEEVLDLCIGCKGCATDCPSGVDLAKLTAELTHQHHERHGASVRDRLFAHIAEVSRWGSRLAPLSNLAPAMPGARRVLERTLGIDRDVPLPTFTRASLRTWFDDRGPGIAKESADRRAILFPDPMTNYCTPAVGRAAVRVLEAAGVHVVVPSDATTHDGGRLGPLDDSGRPAYSNGFLDLAADSAREVVTSTAPLVDAGWDVVAVEPSDAVMFAADYPDLEPGPSTDALAGASYAVCEYLDQFDLDASLPYEPADSLPSVTYHGHCHQKAMRRDHHAVAVLRRAGYAVDPLDSGCCGMAGSFGYEAEHASMSTAIASILFEQVADSSGDVVCAPGTSCRAQLTRRPGTEGRPSTPVELLEARLEGAGHS